MTRDPSLHKSASFFGRVDDADGLQSAMTELHTVHGMEKAKSAALKKQRQGKLPFGAGSAQGAGQAQTEETQEQNADVSETQDESLRPTLGTSRLQEEHADEPELEETQAGVTTDDSQSQGPRPTASKLARFRAQIVS